jgi:hypothetical protein
MMETRGAIGESGLPRGGSPLIYLPIAWVAITALLGAYGIPSSWSAAYDHELPDSVFPLMYAGLAVAAVNILWGLYLCALAYIRSARFPRHFTVWQISNILWLLGAEAYVVVTPEFVFSPGQFGLKLAKIAIGIFCILLLRRQGGSFYSNADTEKPPFIASIGAAVLGLVLGAIAGAVAGFLIGEAIARLTEMSCFEGACGYFVVLISVVGLFVGAIGGCIIAVWRTNRYRRRPA